MRYATSRPRQIMHGQMRQHDAVIPLKITGILEKDGARTGFDSLRNIVAAITRFAGEGKKHVPGSHSAGIRGELSAGYGLKHPLMDVGCRDHGGSHHMFSTTGVAGMMTLATEVSGVTLSERSVLDATLANTGAATWPPAS
jgi:hypothetical protein